MIARKTLSVLVLTILLFWACEKKQQQKPQTVVFYNVENLFDTINEPDKFDEEFLPSAEKQWNTIRYSKKLDDIANVLASIDSAGLPAIVGVCEIENDRVLKDLAMEDQLAGANYEVIWEEGCDARGIDVAMLYNPSVFQPINYKYLPVVDHNDTTFLTREILYVTGMFYEDTLHFYTCHWPSRRGGVEFSEPKRILAAQVLRNHINGILKNNKMAKVIVMGDMNDEPDNMSLSDVLMAMPNKKGFNPDQLINLMYDEYKNERGSYSYRGDWSMLDNLVVTGSLISAEKGVKTSLDDGKIHHKSFMEYVNDRGEMSPNRTYGRTYYGGISDHFPVYLTLE